MFVFDADRLWKPDDIHQSSSRYCKSSVLSVDIYSVVIFECSEWLSHTAVWAGTSCLSKSKGKLVLGWGAGGGGSTHLIKKQYRVYKTHQTPRRTTSVLVRRTLVTQKYTPGQITHRIYLAEHWRWTCTFYFEIQFLHIIYSSCLTREEGLG